MTKVIVSIVLGLFLGSMLWFLIKVANAAPSSKFSSLKNAYVNILVIKDSEPISAGSGVVLWTSESLSLVLSCAHVVSSADVKIFVYQEDDLDSMTKSVPAIIEKISIEEDLVILIAYGPLMGSVQLADIEPPRWAQIYGMGNGLGVGAWPVEGLVASRNYLSDSKRYFRVTLPIIYGFSGGPVVNSDGKLVCLMSKTMTHSVDLLSGERIQTPATNFAMCIPLQRIQDFLFSSSLKL